MELEEIGAAGDGLRAQVSPWGASIFGVQLLDGDEWCELTCSSASLADFVANQAAFGGTCGRFANRIRGGSFELDGTRYQLEVNNGPNSLHGGSAPFHQRAWEVLEKRTNEVVFALSSPDGDGGYPGELRVTAQYRIEGSQLSVVYEASTLAPTIINLTNHVYWNLNVGNDQTVDDHLLQIDADHYMPVDPDGLVTGEIAAVDEVFDFREESVLRGRTHSDHPQVVSARGLDHPFLIRGTGMRRALKLHHPQSGRSLEMFTDQPAVHVYTGNYISEPLPGKAGQTLAARSGIALESENVPDAPNLTGFPSAILRPGESYRHEIRWLFSTR